MKITDTSDLWWKTAVIYCLDIETYMDWDGDGRGDRCDEDDDNERERASTASPSA